ncbi:hypothetical protein L21SP5_00062 [Salinivirga cyanobacteriivorans]|uniref:DUF1456 family protein n=1 Tax=Salinivirga cyanobacteriivorans TaxID=1307839 RepID=A0A0S2HUK7_9BACT|nr:DUF1456 family protein [Salinivirga cyanobacteriivorans]ALO13744.1 hypothetical protein L21SP5_00062 [Salinivirga cyanobacteriivorans]
MVSNNDILRRVRYIFDFGDDDMIGLFSSADFVVTRSQVSEWLKKDEDPEKSDISDQYLAAFLNGLINVKRGKKEGPQPIPEKRLNNNLVLRKLKIALNLRDDDMIGIFKIAGIKISKPELSAFFRKPGHQKYRDCQDQYLRNFLKGLQIKFRSQ